MRCVLFAFESPVSRKDRGHELRANCCKKLPSRRLFARPPSGGLGQRVLDRRRAVCTSILESEHTARRGLRRPVEPRRSLCERSCDVSGRCSLKGVSIRATFVNLKALQTNRLTGRARMNAHKNARSCPLSRALLVKRVCEQGWSVRAASEAVGMTDRRGREWLRQAEVGEPLTDRSSKPHATRSTSGRYVNRFWGRQKGGNFATSPIAESPL